jgi:16S rRNA (guanine527-N7)-methyltransferase
MNYIDSRKDLFLSLGFKNEAFDALKKFVDLIWQANVDMNLVSRQMSFEELIDNHIIDCLLPLKYLASDFKVIADFGSGSGLPAVLFALSNPKTQFHLFEKSPKKQSFLKQCEKIAPNIKVFSLIPEKLNQVELVTARAFKPIDVILQMSKGYYLQGGKYFLLKGRNDKIQEEIILSQKLFKNMKLKVLPLKSPILEVERNLVIIN